MFIHAVAGVGLLKEFIFLDVSLVVSSPI